MNGGKLPDPYTAYAAQAAQVILGRDREVQRLAFRRVLEALQPQGHERDPRQLLDQLERRDDPRTVSFGQMKGQDAKFIGLISPSSKFAWDNEASGKNSVSGGVAKRFPGHDPPDHRCRAKPSPPPAC